MNGQDREIPEPFNIGRLILLNKEPEKQADISNLRPININSTLLKILESIVLNQLKLDGIQQKIHQSQNGFMPNKNTIFHIESLINLWKLHKFIIFIDLKAAFDSIPHEELIKKLENFCNNKQNVELIKILYNKIYTKIFSNTEPIKIEKGVLQGSLILPLLFVIFINDLLIELDNIGAIPLCFADDLSIACKNIKILEKTIKIIENWCFLNKMIINKKKSAIFILHQKDQLINHFEFKKNTDGESYFYEFPIRKEYKYMGITFTNKLKITQHIEILKDWSNKFYNQISKNIIEKFSPKLRIEIFKIFYQSKIFYGFPIIC